MKKFNKKILKNEVGQSLVETIIILPLFFMILSGIIMVFQQQLRVFSDELAQNSLNITQAHFDERDKKKVHWQSENISKQSVLENLTNNALNPSAYFSNSVDMKNGVFFDKKKLKKDTLNSSSSCSDNPSFNISAQDNGKYNLKTCGKDSAYESYENKFLKYFNLTPQNFDGNSIYYPHFEFSWNMRSKEAVNAASEFSTSINGIAFMKNQASLLPIYSGKFNSKCYMEPFHPDCNINAIGGKFSRTATESANAQIFLCGLEILLNCSVSNVGYLVCVAAAVEELAASIALGEKAFVCSRVNSMVEANQSAVKGMATAYKAAVNGSEFAQRGQVVINK